MRMNTIMPIAMAAAIICVLPVVGLIAQPARSLQYESFYYNDEVYFAINPGGNSANTHQLTFGCFNLGPDLNGKVPATKPLPVFYAVFWPGGSLHGCPDGTLAHDHVATVLPGHGFSPHWRAVFVIPISGDAPLPLTSAAAVEAAAAAGQVVLIDTGLIFNAPVVRREGL